MKSHYSIIKYVNNSLTNETISLGLIAISNNEIFFHLSGNKIELAKKLNIKNFKLLDFSIKQLKNFVENDSFHDNSKLFDKDRVMDFTYLNRLSNYNNGILQFSKPETIDSVINQSIFEDYINKLVGTDIVQTLLKSELSPFKGLIKQKLYEPLENQIDVNFTLKKNQLESLFFDFHLDAIGVNGSLYAAKAIDFNSNRQLSLIRTDISEYESVIERLNLFADKRGLSKVNNYYLVIDSYRGNQPSYNDLYSLLKQDNMPLFKILESNEVDKFAKQVIKNNARKFSTEVVFS